MTASVPLTDIKPNPATVKILTAIALGGDMPAIDGKQLRLQLTTYNPGNRNTWHTHEGKVEVVHILSGEVVEHHADGRDVVHRAGDSFTANKDTTHYMENVSAEPAQLLVAMILDKS